MATDAAVALQKSTNDRFFRAPQPIRMAFRVLEQVAPAIGARWAERIWFRLPRRGRAARAPSVDPGSRSPSASARSTSSAWPGVRARWCTCCTAGPGTAANWSRSSPGLVSRGFKAVAFDAPSHGGSGPGAFGPRSSSIPEFAGALNAVVAEHGPAEGIVAHSLGSVAAAVASATGCGPGRVAMIAPMASPASYARHFARCSGSGHGPCGGSPGGSSGGSGRPCITLTCRSWGGPYRCRRR